MKLSGRLIHVSELTAADRRQMLRLMDEHYANVTREVFDADLAEKQWVIQVVHPVEGVCGFSTQMVLDAQLDGRAIKALFSGDTVIDRKHWGDQALSHVWGRFALSLVDATPQADWYWFLISQGYKTYRFLPIFFHEFYPRHDRPTPVEVDRVLHALAVAKFPQTYDQQAGVVRAHAGQYRLRVGVADTTPGRLRDPHVHFFVDKNPLHAAGDELCCVAPLSRENFTPAAYRVMGLEPDGHPAISFEVSLDRLRR